MEYGSEVVTPRALFCVYLYGCFPFVCSSDIEYPTRGLRGRRLIMLQISVRKLTRHSTKQRPNQIDQERWSQIEPRLFHSKVDIDGAG